VASPATQNVADRQDADIRNMRTGPLTELAAFESTVGSMAVAGLQEVPLNVNALEPLSTAAQNLGDEHDTDAMPLWVPGTGSLRPGAELHVLPLNAKVDESCASVAMQKVTVGHDTESGSSAEEDSLVGWLHVVPSYLTVPPARPDLPSSSPR